MAVSMRFGAAGDNAGRRPQIARLWSNPDTTTSFAGQTVNLADSLTHYDIIFVSYFFSTGAQTLYSDLFMAADLLAGATAGLRINAGSSNRVGSRPFTAPTAGTVSFSSASYNGSTSNTYVIPAAVYGVKL